MADTNDHPQTAMLACPAPTYMGDDGRIGWPDVFNYVWSNDIEEVRSPCPPRNKWPYRVEVVPARLDTFAEILSSGVLYDNIHTGRTAMIFESGERRTTQ